MLRHKLIDRVCCAVLVLTLLVSALFVGAAATGHITEDTNIGYETRLFDQSRVHTIDIVMQDWDAFLKTATSEEYSACQMVIDGEHYKNVAIRGKGNTSLSSVAAYGNNRYSFKVEFDHYQNGMTYHGLDKLSLNNLIQDNTYMKDYFAYTLMNKMGVAAPLCSFVQINVNGEPWGLYLAVEGVEDSFLQRNYGKSHGELYKPDAMSMGGGRGNGEDFDMGDFDFAAREEENAQGGARPEASGDDSFGGSAGDSSGGSAGGQSVTTAPTATPEPTATPVAEATPAPARDASNGDSAADAASTGDAASAGDAASTGDGASSGMPADGTVPADFDPAQMAASAGTSASPETSAAPVVPADDFQMPTGDFKMPDMGGFGSSSDVKLQYANDDPFSYSNIFNNAKTEINTADKTRLIASLKALNEGDVSVVDTEAVIRYMAVHNFLCNDDSYTGMMVHNYYLYEENGVLSMIPWDYNLGYGCFTGGSNGTSAVNTSIRRLVSNGSASDRPMAGWITASEEYTAQYLATYQEFMTTVFDSGWFAKEIDRVMAMIDPYVQKEHNAFCTYEEFLKGSSTLKSFCLKRAESVNRQLKGNTTSVDASDLKLSEMGTMNNGGGFGRDRGQDSASRGERTQNAPTKPAADEATEPARGERTQNAPTKPAADEATEPARDERTQNAPTKPAADEATEPARDGETTPSFSSMVPRQSRTASKSNNALWLAGCALLLLIAVAVVCGWKNHR